jgi:hypothetical protein
MKTQRPWTKPRFLQPDVGGFCKILLDVRVPGMLIASSGSSLDRGAGLLLPPLNVHALHQEPQAER